MNVHVRRHSMEILDYSGHRTITWDPADEAAIADARAQFEALRAQGFSIFRMVAVGQHAVTEELGGEVDDFDPAMGRMAARMDEFDPTAERSTAIPQRVGG